MCANSKCSCTTLKTVVETERHVFVDVEVTLDVTYRQCESCGQMSIMPPDAEAAQLAIAKAIVAAGSRNPNSFTLCHTLIGLPISEPCKIADALRTDIASVLDYKATGEVQSDDWWKHLTHLVINAKSKQPLPPCRSSYVGA